MSQNRIVTVPTVGSCSDSPGVSYVAGSENEAGVEEGVEVDAGERACLVCVDHLLQRGAPLGQVLQKREALGGIGPFGVVEPRLLPVADVHPIATPRTALPTAGHVPCP